MTMTPIRATEMAGLTTMHTLFLREHNAIARTIRDHTRGLTGDEIFFEARRILNAEYQNVVYSEFLEAVLGARKAREFDLDVGVGFTDYDPGVRPAILNEFATAAFRFGHTLIQGMVVPREVPDKEELEPYALRDVFFNENLARTKTNVHLQPVGMLWHGMISWALVGNVLASLRQAWLKAWRWYLSTRLLTEKN